MDKITAELWAILGPLVGLPERVQQFSIALNVDKSPVVNCKYLVDDLSDDVDEDRRMVVWKSMRSFRVVPIEEPYVSIQSGEEQHPILPTVNPAPMKNDELSYKD